MVFEDTLKILVSVICALFVAVFGMWASGIFYDALWSTGDSFHNQDCNTLQNDWVMICKQDQASYEGSKTVIQLAVSVGSFVSILFVALQRLEIV